MQQFARPGHRPAGKFLGQIGRQPGLDAGLGQTFGQIEHVGRARARHGGHRDRAGAPRRPRPLRRRRAAARRKVGAARRSRARWPRPRVMPRADRGRRVRHRPHHGGARRADAVRSPRSCGRPQSTSTTVFLPGVSCASGGKHLVHHLRLDGHDDDRRRLGSAPTHWRWRRGGAFEQGSVAAGGEGSCRFDPRSGRGRARASRPAAPRPCCPHRRAAECRRS